MIISIGWNFSSINDIDYWLVVMKLIVSKNDVLILLMKRIEIDIMEKVTCSAFFLSMFYFLMGQRKINCLMQILLAAYKVFLFFFKSGAPCRGNKWYAEKDINYNLIKSYKKKEPQLMKCFTNQFKTRFLYMSAIWCIC